MQISHQGVFFLLTGINFHPSMDKYVHPLKSVGWITHPSSNFNAAIQVWEWVSNFILHSIMDVVTSSLSIFIKGFQEYWSSFSNSTHASTTVLSLWYCLAISQENQWDKRDSMFLSLMMFRQVTDLTAVSPWHGQQYHNSRIHTHRLCFVMIFCGQFMSMCTHTLQGYFTGTRAIIWLPWCQGNNPEEYG